MKVASGSVSANFVRGVWAAWRRAPPRSRIGTQFDISAGNPPPLTMVMPSPATIALASKKMASLSATVGRLLRNFSKPILYQGVATVLTASKSEVQIR